MSEHDDLDREIIDQERAAEIARMADAQVAELDAERRSDAEDAERNIERQMADLEREWTQTL